MDDPKKCTCKVKDSWAALSKKVTDMTSTASIKQAMTLAFKAFDKSTKFPYEMCDYVDKMIAQDDPLRKLIGTCNLKDGFYGVDAPLSLIDKVTERLDEKQDVDAIIMNGDFVAHDMAIDVEKKWTFDDYK